jgi:hypothetical protein
MVLIGIETVSIHNYHYFEIQAIKSIFTSLKKELKKAEFLAIS